MLAIKNLVRSIRDQYDQKSYNVKLFKVTKSGQANINSIRQNEKFIGSAPTKMDSRVDMSCVGQNFIPFSHTGEICVFAPYNDSYKFIHDVKVCSTDTEIEDPETGLTVICEVHQALNFGTSLNNSLLNPNQIRAFGLTVNDNPFSKRKFFGIVDQKKTSRSPSKCQME